ncbi:protein disulfide isomerase [Anaeramoeba ignava]|uniref:Protein disulfide isomerase n=1 Tax=Anaeramoeba ignava TaxID=1746090 RepID=A0A9Q0LCF1_ANAIG|nr:protein disulfide isomerase [Anaeramoeba ignava]
MSLSTSKFYLVIFIILISIFSVRNYGNPIENKLTSTNLKQFMKTHNPTLILITAPNCLECDALEQILSLLSSRVPHVTVAKIDFSEDPQAVKQIGASYPKQIFIYIDGNYREFSVPGNVDYMAEKLSTVEDPKVVLITRDNKLEFFSNNDVKIVGFFKKTNSIQFEALQKVAKLLQFELRFGYFDSMTVAKSVKLKKENTIAIIKPGEPPVFFDQFESIKEKSTSDSLFESLLKFIDKNKQQIVTELTSSNYARHLFNIHTPVLVLFCHEKEIPKQSSFLRKLNQELKKITPIKDNYFLRNPIPFYIHNIDKSQNLAEFFKIDPAVVIYPHLIVTNPSERTIFPFKRKQRHEIALKINEIIEWMFEFYENKLSPQVKSEKEPIKNNGAVRILTANNFPLYVTGSDEEWVVEFMSDSCSHCKSFNPIFSQIASSFYKVNGINFGQFNVMKNDLDPALEVVSLPTVLFFPKDKSQPFQRLTAQRTPENVISFIISNSLLSLDKIEKKEL